MSVRESTSPPNAEAAIAPQFCPLCGQPNDCQLCTSAAYKGPCWCMKVNIPEALCSRVPPEARNKACVCRACVTDFQREQARAQSVPVLAGDFYFDSNGLMVFTEAYHLRRGYCCGNSCRHCPYPDPK